MGFTRSANAPDSSKTLTEPFSTISTALYGAPTSYLVPYIVMALMAMAYIVMAYTVMSQAVMAYVRR